MRTARDRYFNDNQYRHLVDWMVSHIMACDFTPSEMREAAILASIKCEEIRIPHHSIPICDELEQALATVRRYVREEKQK